jgi:hypothetical protein
LTVKQWNIGDVATSADMNTWTVPLVAVKPGDTSRSSTTTQTNDPDLTATVAANATYWVDMWLGYEGGTQGASDLKFGFAVPASATLRSSATYTGASGGAITEVYYASGGAALTPGTNGAGNIRGVSLRGTLITAGSSGTFALSWAQNTSSGTATVLHTGSALKLTRIG